MSRSGYSDDLEQWDSIRYRGQVASAIRGKRGQAFLKELIAALDAMPEKRLIAHELVAADGQVCALGAVAVARGLDTSAVDIGEPRSVAELFGIAWQLAAEIEYLNDNMEYLWRNRTPEQRWQDMRDWAERSIKT